MALNKIRTLTFSFSFFFGGECLGETVTVAIFRLNFNTVKLSITSSITIVQASFLCEEEFPANPIVLGLVFAFHWTSLVVGDFRNFR